MRYSHTCLRCGNVWKGYTEIPKQCSKCRNSLWNVPRIYNLRNRHKYSSPEQPEGAVQYPSTSEEVKL